MKATMKSARKKADTARAKLTRRKPDVAKRILIAQAVLIVGGVTALLIREMPGAVREYRMWRMAKLRR